MKGGWCFLHSAVLYCQVSGQEIMLLFVLGYWLAPPPFYLYLPWYGLTGDGAPVGYCFNLPW